MEQQIIIIIIMRITIGTDEQPSEQKNTIVANTQNQNIANSILPYAGRLTPVMGIVALIILANAIYSIIKYKRYKDF